MANKPANLCELQKDKFVGGQKGFVDTFNWATQAINNLEGGKNCTVDWTIPDHPIINVEATEGGGGGGSGGGDGVYDVFASTSDGVDGIGVDYIRAKPDSFIPFPSMAGVSFIGTDNTVTSTATQFRISPATNSNVVVTASGTTLTIGVYYI